MFYSVSAAQCLICISDIAFQLFISKANPESILKLVSSSNKAVIIVTMSKFFKFALSQAKTCFKNAQFICSISIAEIMYPFQKVFESTVIAKELMNAEAIVVIRLNKQ